jgi:hypothetical protein
MAFNHHARKHFVHKHLPLNDFGVKVPGAHGNKLDEGTFILYSLIEIGRDAFLIYP